jgi:uncharacterized membrane protein
MTMLAIAGLFFLAIHVLPVTRLRGQAIAAIGEGPYLGVFSLVSLLAIWWWVRAFEDAPYDARLWSYAAWWPWLKAALVLFAFILLVAGLSSPNPTLPRGGNLLDRPDVGAGIFAVTRHPAMWAFGIWGIAHFLSQPNWRGFWFFGIFAITALGGALLQEVRKARQYGASWQRFTAKTSFVPFVALMQGRASLRLADIGWWRIALAVLLWAALLYLHARLFGVAPLPGLA